MFVWVDHGLEQKREKERYRERMIDLEPMIGWNDWEKSEAVRSYGER